MRRIVRSRQCFDVRIPPAKKQILASHLVPTVRHSMVFGITPGKQRRISIEVHSEGDEEEAFLSPSQSSLSSSSPKSATQQQQPSPNLPRTTSDFFEGDHCVIRVLKRKKSGSKVSCDVEDDGDDDDDTSEGSCSEDATIVEEDGFVQSKKFDLDAFVFDETKINKSTIEVKLGRGSNKEVRDIKFASESDAQEFFETIKRLQELETQRALELAHEFHELSPRSLVSQGDEERVNLLIELVSATDLPAADLMGLSDPYVIVYLGRKEMHRTDVLYKTLNPIWTVASGSLFLLQVPTTEFFKASAGLTFQVNDNDMAGKDDVLGHVSVSQHELLEANGERIEHPLEITLKGYHKSHTNVFDDTPRLNIRVRPATEQDEAFMHTLRETQRKYGKNKFGVFAGEAHLPLKAVHAANALHRESKRSPATGEVLHRVKPGPDPDRPVQETKWLTKKQINEQFLKPSTGWTESGSGKLGMVYLEVLKCDGLPNMDTGGGLHDKTDAYCTVLYEDAVVNTDVVFDELSPRWMPWTQRAFVFHMEHPSSQIHVGVFDYNSLKSSNPIGRVSIDISGLCAKTEYTLTYNLYKKILHDKRLPQGTVTVRLRLDVDTGSQMWTSLTTPPPMNFVNLMKKDDFRMSCFITSGKEDRTRLDMNALEAYVNELTGYTHAWSLVVDSMKTVCLWRGHYKVSLLGLEFKLPLHSVIGFCLGVFLVENYERLPSFLFFSMAWLLLATNEHRQRSASPWEKSPSFLGLWVAFLTGRSSAKRRTIPPIPEIETKPHDEPIQQDAKKPLKKQISIRPNLQRVMDATEAYTLQEEKKQEEENIENIETKASNGHFHMFHVWAPLLFPIQECLEDWCLQLRIGKSFLNWDEPFYAFIMTNVFIAAGFAVLFVPWGWLLRWALRVLVLIALGPWNKLIDIFIVQKLEAKGDNSVKRTVFFVQKESGVIDMHKRAIQIRRETAENLKENKKYMFGEFIVKLPQYKAYRFPDKPLPFASEAKPYDPHQEPINIVKHKHGQRLVGSMIPQWGDEEDAAFLEAKAKVHRTIIQKANPVRLAGTIRSTFRRKGTHSVKDILTSKSSDSDDSDRHVTLSSPLSLVSRIHHSFGRRRNEKNVDESETGFSSSETDSLLANPVHPSHQSYTIAAED